MLLQNRIDCNTVLEYCQTCYCLERLFIKQEVIKPPILRINKTKKSQTRKRTRKGRVLLNYIERTKISNYVATTLFVVCCLLASIYNEKVVSGQQQQQVEIKTQTSLPTVIVRGFLNYRTTVDGTVLLFTPDAGSSSSSVNVQNIAPSSAPAFNFAASSTQIKSSQLSSIQLVEPTSVLRQQPLVSSTFFIRPIDMPENDSFSPVNHSNENQHQLLSNDQQGSVAADQWRPVQATPPLKSSMQTTFKPNLFNSAADEPVLQTSSMKNQLLASVSTSGSDAPREQDNRSTPSVQADDILPSEPNSAQQSPSNQSRSTMEVATSPVTPVSRAMRPKRPSLGFNGQGLRSRAGNRFPNNNQNEPANTINGIRRPGLSTTSTTTTPAPQSSSSQASGGESSNVMGAFNSRLTNASARLRNKLRRPPVGSNSSLAGSMSTASASLLQSNESGNEDLLSGSGSIENHQLAVAAAAAAAASTINQGINPDQSTSLSLTSRIGDIFNAGSALIGTSPVVGNDDILAAATSRGESTHSKPGNNQQGSDASIELFTNSSDFGQESETKSSQDTGMKPTSRSGEQKPHDDKQAEPQLLSGGLTATIEPLPQGQLGNMPLSFDNFFQNDQPIQTGNSESSSEPQPSFRSKESQASLKNGGKNNNDRLNSWLGTHHNKFIPRPSLTGHHGHDQPGQLSHQLAANLNQLAPSFSSNLPASPSSSSAMVNGSGVKPTPVSNLVTPSLPVEVLKPSVGSIDELSSDASVNGNRGANETSNSVKHEEELIEKNDQLLNLQTITKTYSTIMTKSKTRLVPLQVKSNTAIYTITENYVITKMLTAYQTMPIGEFILPETMSTRAPYEMFNEQQDEKSKEPSVANQAPNPVGFSSGGSLNAVETQPEQPISLETSQKSPNDWLHDFSNLNNANFNSNSSPQQQQTNNLAALLEQQAQEANLASLPSLIGNEPLDQLASSLDSTADGTINIPDLNNPLVLAAAIQNPQLAAVILAAQQLQLKQRQNKLNQQQQNVNNNNIQPAILLQPSYSTSLSTTVKPSIYTVRDTMYTTRLVSFKDGRTVRTRTVSEPGSVIEQVLTTLATEVTPVTMTIRPTAMLSGALATAAPGAGLSGQATINNALFATQLANLLARRQQVVQPSMAGPSSLLAAAANLQQQQQPNFNQMAALQQLIGQQQQQQQRQQAKQFQPNIQQLLKSMQQQPSLSPSSLSLPNNLAQSSAANPASAASDKSNSGEKKAQEVAALASQTATPVLSAQPIITTLTNLQVKTYTVHNAFKTIYRTITSTQLITSTIFPGATRLPNLG